VVAVAPVEDGKTTQYALQAIILSFKNHIPAILQLFLEKLDILFII